MGTAEDSMLRAFKIVGGVIVGIAVGVLGCVGYVLWRIFG